MESARLKDRTAGRGPLGEGGVLAHEGEEAVVEVGVLRILHAVAAPVEQWVGVGLWASWESELSADCKSSVGTKVHAKSRSDIACGPKAADGK